VSRSSSSLNLAMPARSSSLAIQYWISYSFPSSNGPSFKPTSWISGQLRLHITRTGVFSKVKSVSLMAVDCFAVNVVDCSFSPERHCPRELLFYRFKVTEEMEVIVSGVVELRWTGAVSCFCGEEFISVGWA